MTRRGMNWNAVRARNVMRRRGTENSRDDSESMVRRVAEHSTNRPPPKTKQELRAEAARAFIAWRREKAAREGQE
jgi:hypothetical protein